MIDVKIKLAPGTRLPTQGSEESAGFDIYSTGPFELHPGIRRRIPTGISAAIPKGYEAQIRPRSGLALAGVDVILGTIDSDYRGDWGIIMENTSTVSSKFLTGDRIAQVVFSKVPRVYMQVVQELDETDRGANGFGSTGV